MIVFFLRAYNDIDHIVPIIDEWLIKKDKKIAIVITDPFINFRDDYRLKYIQQTHGIVPQNILDFCPVSSLTKKLFYKYVITSRADLKGMSPFKRAWYAILGRIIRFFTWKRVLLSRHDFDADKLLDRCGMVERLEEGLLIFDHNVGPIPNRIIAAGRKRGFKSIALPHGISNLQNLIYLCRDLSIKIDPEAEKRMNVFDEVFFCEKYTAEKKIKQGLERERIKIMGSVRYSVEWMKKLEQEILPKDYKLPEVPDDKLKIVMFLTKEKNGVFVDEIYRTIKYITKFPNVFLIVKPHTRKMQFSADITTDNLLIEDKNIPSSVLIDWSDLVLFSATSIVLECLRKDKPILFLRKTIYNKMVYEYFIHSWDIECRDDLMEWMWKFLENKKTRTYSKQDADRCLKELIGGRSDNVLEDHIKEICSLMKKNKV